MQANTDLFEIAKIVRASAELSHVVIVTPSKFLMESLREHPEGGTLRIQHGQTLTIDGDAGTVLIHEGETAQAR